VSRFHTTVLCRMTCNNSTCCTGTERLPLPHPAVVYLKWNGAAAQQFEAGK
jgi:hypothetical protein